MIDPLIAVRFVHMAATVLATGTVAFMALVADVPQLRRRLAWTVWAALAVAIVSGVVWLGVVAADILGGSFMDACLHGGAWQVAADTRFGLVWCVRLVLALGLAALMPLGGARWAAMAVAAIFTALLAFAGHAGATPGTAGNIHLASDMVHLLAASVWLGALPALALLLAQAPRSDIAVATRRFSALGIVCVAALLASGIVNTWNLIETWRDLITTEYGRLIALKIGLFAAMTGIAAVNKFHLTPRLPGAAAARALQRNSLIEFAFGLGVLLFVAMLGTMPPSSHAHQVSTEIPPHAAFVHIHDAEAMADVIINPGHAGQTAAIIRVMREDSSELDAQVVGITLEPPKRGGPVVTRKASRTVDGTWRADDLMLEPSGIWTVRVIVTPARGKAIVLDAPIVIEP